MNKFLNTFLKVFFLCLIPITQAISAQNLPLDSNGWTIFTPSSDSRIIYVSNSNGNNATATTYTAAQVGDPFNPSGNIKAYKTVAEAKKQLRDNYPDWILFKRGDAWYEPIALNFKHSGRSANEPMLFGAYGDMNLARPVFKTGESTCLSVVNNGLSSSGNDFSNYLAFVSLHANANERNPDDPEYTGSKGTGQKGCNWVRKSNGILFEDMKFDFYATNFAFQASWAPRGELVINNLTIRRCVITDAYQAGKHRQGMFINNCKNVLIEENVIDYNGWRQGVSNTIHERLLGHNIYAQYQNGPGTFTVRNNIITRGSSHGVQLRCGGVMNGNYFARNPLHSFNRGDFFPCINNDNVYQESVDISGSNGDTPRGMALELFDLHPNYNHECKRNIISNDLSGVYNSFAIRVSDYSAALIGEPETDYKTDWPSYAYNLTVEGNVVYNHRRGFHFVSDTSDGITVKNNIIQNPAFDNIVMEETPSGNHTNMVFSGNKYYSASSEPFRLNKNYINFNQWVSTTGETGSKFEQVTFLDPGRTSADYSASLGFNSSFDAFIAEARKQRKGFWRKEFMSLAINNYIREGYGVDPVVLSASEFKSNKLKMYPNPVSNNEVLNISLDNIGNSTVRILDLKGAIIYTEVSKTSNLITIDVNKILKPGFYIVSVTASDAKIYNSKLIVK